MSLRQMTRVRPLLILLALAALSGPVAGQGQQRAEQRNEPYGGLTFRNIGPASMAGRVDDLAVLESNPAIFYVGTAAGGLWKTTNSGTTWETLFDDLDDVVSIGDIAITPDDPNTVWVGSGENNNRQSGSWGNGVYKSTDGGQTWKHMGLRESKHIGRIIVDPIDHDVVYVAALGSLYGASKERGVFKTIDGGNTWTNVMFVNEDTGATELVQDPSNNKVLYAATYQRRRSGWGMNGGGPGSGIHKSSDGGRTWTRLTNGIPSGSLGRIGMDIYRKNPNVLYARIEHESESGTYRSDDAGLTWRKMSDLNPRPMYFSQIRIDPTNDLRIYVLGVDLHVSDDGGKTFVLQESMHDDHHAMWINPNNPNHIIQGTDGGVGISWDRTKTFEPIYNMDLGQAYHVGYDMARPYNLCVGLQDNYVWCGPSAVRSRRGIVNDDWTTVQGGDGFEAVIDPTDPRIIYTESQDGNINRVDRVTNERKSIRPIPARGEPALRWNWNTPIMISPHDPKTVYVGANRVFRSTDGGHSFAAVSPELTQAIDREGLPIMGVVGKDQRIAKNDGVQSYGNLTQLVESPKTPGVLYAGSDDGSVQMTKDGGKTWTNVSSKFPGAPKNAYVSGLVASTHDANTVYAAFDNHFADDMNNYVYASADGGNTWRSIGEGIPKGMTVTTITEDPKNPNVLYAGTEYGVFVTPDRGGSWDRLRANLPTVPIHEITIHPRDNDMILATHGRSVWILDDATPIQQAAEARRADAFLFDIRAAMQYNQANDRGFVADKQFFGRNPEYGALITYHLRNQPKDVALRIRDAAGTLVREITGNDLRNARRAGFNRVAWDLRHQPLPAQEGQAAPGGGGGGGFGGGGNNGPNVMPGEYRVTLVVDGKDVATKPVRVTVDPVVQMTDADRKTWHDTALALHDLQRTANDAADAVAQMSRQFQALESALRVATNVPSSASSAVAETGKRLADLRTRLGVPAPAPAEGGRGGGGGRGGAGGGGGGGRGGTPNVRGTIGQTKGQIMQSTSLPTAQQSRTATESREDLVKVVADTNAMITEFPSLYDKIGLSALKPAALKPIRAVGAAGTQ